MSLGSSLECVEKFECDIGEDIQLEDSGEDEDKQDYLEDNQDYLDDKQDYLDDNPTPGTGTGSVTGANNWLNTAFGLCLQNNLEERIKCQSVLMQKILGSIATVTNVVKESG